MVTPQTSHPDIARELGISALYLKREDLHPYGSHKGRSIPHMIDSKVAGGATHFAISSSGNAALAAVRHIQKLNRDDGRNLSLSVLVGKNINPAKKAWLISEISDPRITLTETERPLQSLLNLIKGTKMVSLRQSTDDTALEGYKALADELLAIPDLSSVFIASSSGTTAQALLERFKELKKAISVYIVQTTEVSPIAGDFDTTRANTPKTVPAGNTPVTEKSLADAIVDRVAHRREALGKLIENKDQNESAQNEKRGGGFIASNNDILAAQKMLRDKAGINATGNGSLSLAGLICARAQNITLTGAVVCIVTGK